MLSSPNFSGGSPSFFLSGATSRFGNLAIWKPCTKSCLDVKLIKSHIDTICCSVVFMKYWEGSNDIAYQDSLRRGVENLVDVAMAAYEANPPHPFWIY
jgi:hypothetical protein